MDTSSDNKFIWEGVNIAYHKHFLSIDFGIRVTRAGKKHQLLASSIINTLSSSSVETMPRKKLTFKLF